MSLFLSIALAVTSSPPPPARILVLGMYHMANPKLDMVKVDIRDTMGADRQREIGELVDRIAKFKPTKIAVEAVPPAGGLSKRYKEYLAGAPLASDEIEQVGFRLAKRFDQPGLFPIDSRYEMDFDAVMQSAAKQGKQAFLKRVEEVIPKVAQALADLDKDHTVSEILAAMNAPEGLRANHSFYMEMLDADDGKEFPGSDLTGGWYMRNLRIFSNLKRLVQPGDRVLVLFGAGHAKLLSDFVRDTRGMKLEDPMKYLPKPPKLNMDF